MKRLLGVALILLILVPSPLRAADGDLDTTFGSGGIVITDFGGDDVATSVALQSDGKIVAAGRTLVGGVSSFALGRYNSDGSLDTTFGTGGKVTTDSLGDAFALAIQSDGKIVVAGGRTQSPSNFALARYNSDGSLDSTFGSGGKVVRTDFSGLFVALVLQPDGKIVVAGGKNGDFVLVRYNVDGSLDTTFGSGGTLTTDFSGRDDEAYALAIQSDGKIVAAGRTTTTSGSVLSDFALARYNSDGSLDASFGNGGKVTTAFESPFPGAAYAMALQPDGKIVAAGGGLDVESGIRLARYNSDGSLDITFGVGGKVGLHDPDGKSVALQPDGKIVVGTYPFVSDVSLIRYNNDGSLDATFGTGGYVPGDGANALVLQSDGKIVAAGESCALYCDFALARYQSSPSTGMTDFNGDGKTDLVWQHMGTGQIVTWLMDGTTLIASRFFNPGQVDPSWKIVGTGDFNADRKTDLVWQNDGTGEIVLWFMDGTSLISWAFFNPSAVPDTTWKIVTIGDFNGDGKPDLIWQRDGTGEVAVWFMNGTSLISGQFFNPSQEPNTNWKIVGTGDFNGDGKPDLVWHNSVTGDIRVWWMNGINRIAEVAITPSPVSDTNWKVAGVGDFNRDGKPDLIWQRDGTGEIAVWFMNGTSLISGQFFNPSQVSDLQWKIRNR